MRTIRVQGTFRAVIHRHGVDDDLSNTARVNLKMERPSDRILPYLMVHYDYERGQ